MLPSMWLPWFLKDIVEVASLAPEKVTALTDSTMHDDDDGTEENQGGGTSKGRGERGEGLDRCLAR